MRIFMNVLGVSMIVIGVLSFLAAGMLCIFMVQGNGVIDMSALKITLCGVGFACLAFCSLPLLFAQMCKEKSKTYRR